MSARPSVPKQNWHQPSQRCSRRFAARPHTSFNESVFKSDDDVLNFRRRNQYQMALRPVCEVLGESPYQSVTGVTPL